MPCLAAAADDDHRDARPRAGDRHHRCRKATHHHHHHLRPSERAPRSRYTPTTAGTTTTEPEALRRSGLCVCVCVCILPPLFARGQTFAGRVPLASAVRVLVYHHFSPVVGVGSRCHGRCAESSHYFARVSFFFLRENFFNPYRVSNFIIIFFSR